MKIKQYNFKLKLLEFEKKLQCTITQNVEKYSLMVLSWPSKTQMIYAYQFMFLMW